MTVSKIELARELLARWNAGRHGMADLEELFDPAFEMESPLSAVSGEPYRGYAGVERWVQDLDTQFSRWHIDTTEVREVGERVLMISTISARGRTSGVELEFPSAGVLCFAPDGRLARVRIYADVQEALAAVGLTG